MGLLNDKGVEVTGYSGFWPSTLSKNCRTERTHRFCPAARSITCVGGMSGAVRHLPQKISASIS